MRPCLLLLFALIVSPPIAASATGGEKTSAGHVPFSPSWWRTASRPDSTLPPLTRLEREHPALHALYRANASLHAVLERYATMQGFTRPHEFLVTVVHELIHIDSAAHEGFFIEGRHYEPYLRPGAWPAATHADIEPRMTRAERERMTLIHRAYVLNTPGNRLPNVVDEVNAYAQTVPFLCRNEPVSVPTHLEALAGHLNLLDTWLRILESIWPVDYLRLATHPDSRGALETVAANGLKALAHCAILGLSPLTAPGTTHLHRLNRQPPP